MGENSVDSIVTDPPYGWRFMGKAWDGEDIVTKAKADVSRVRPGDVGRKKGAVRTEGSLAGEAGSYDLSVTGNQAFQHFTEEWAREAFRVLKPGGHMLVFCGPRTYHRMASGVEDAGFEIRDQLQWLFGSGFPKSLSIDKAIDKAAGAEREVVGVNPNHRGESQMRNPYTKSLGQDGSLTAPSTDAAKQWQGWGTALKPANEPIVLARKPLSEKTVAANVMKWGTGGINVDGCRIQAGDSTNWRPNVVGQQRESEGDHIYGEGVGKLKKAEQHPHGRFPSNLLLDETAAEMLDGQSGVSKSPTKVTSGAKSTFNATGRGQKEMPCFGDTGGASRFFYCAKSSKRERNEGLEGMPEKEKQGARPNSADASGKFPDHDHRPSGGNNHPTVKPITLMRYLCRLVTPQGGKILDPFCGSGSTGVAALKEGFRFIGIEREAEYVAIAERRLQYSEGEI